MLGWLSSAVSLAKDGIQAARRCRAWLAGVREARRIQAENAKLRTKSAELHSRVSELDSRLNSTKDLVYSSTEGVYWKEQNGQRQEGPFCQLCADCDGKAVRLIPGATRGTYHCNIHRETFTTAHCVRPRPFRLRRRARREF